MSNNVPVLFVVGVVALAALVAFAVYRCRQRERARRINEWVDAYLLRRFGGPLDRVSVNCSEDTLWPVLVGLDDPRTGLWHRLRFSCPGAPATFSLLSEEQGKR